MNELGWKIELEDNEKDIFNSYFGEEDTETGDIILLM